MKATLTGRTARFWSRCSSCFVEVHWPDVLYEIILDKPPGDPQRYAYICRGCRDELRGELRKAPTSG